MFNNQLEYEIFGQLSQSEQDQRFFSSINQSIDQMNKLLHLM